MPTQIIHTPSCCSRNHRLLQDVHICPREFVRERSERLKTRTIKQPLGIHYFSHQDYNLKRFCCAESSLSLRMMTGTEPTQVDPEGTNRPCASTRLSISGRESCTKRHRVLGVGIRGMKFRNRMPYHTLRSSAVSKVSLS